MKNAQSCLAAALLLGTALGATAQNLPYQVKDIWPGPGGGMSGSGTELVVIDEVAYFVADDTGLEKELWRTDGTEAGTSLVKEIWVDPFNGGSPRELTVYAGEVYFSAENNIEGRELWKSDGTEAGTVMVKDLRPGIAGATPENLWVAGGQLFFNAFDDTNTEALWRSDGTDAGTVKVATLDGTFLATNSTYQIAYKGELFFNFSTTAEGDELWKSDGTEAGTVLVKDLNAGGAGSQPQEFVILGGALYFRANDGTGTRLWKSDGTAAGTEIVSTAITATNLAAHNDTLYFQGFEFATGQELWKSDGTGAGTVMVKDIAAGSSSSRPSGLTAAGGVLFFDAWEPVAGREMYTSDGTEAGTELLLDINPGFGGGSAIERAALGSRLYFDAFDKDLWVSDGTEIGTLPIQPGTDLDPDFWSTGILDDLLFFVGNGADGKELWAVSGALPGPSFTVSAAACPGPATFSILGGVPDGFFGLLGAVSEGSWVVPPGVICEGTELDLDNPFVVGVIDADELGNAIFDINLPPGACGKTVQAVDARITEPCRVSNTQALPDAN